MEVSLMVNHEQNLLDLIKRLDIKGKQNWVVTTDGVDNLDEDKVNKDDGYVEVRDHQLFVINQTNAGKQPTLLPNLNLNITINSNILRRESPVFEGDIIEWKKKGTSLPYAIQISEDKLSVFLQVHPELFQEIQLKNKRRSTRFLLEIEYIDAQCNVEEVSSAIVEDIMKRGIQAEINTTAIIQELINPTFHQILVAEGLPIIPSRDAVLEKYFSNDLKEVIEEVDGKADFKNRLKIPTVETGQVIAKLNPPKEGKEGYTVFGQTLKPKPPKNIEVRTKPRVRITDDGKIIALQPGRPSVTGRSVKHVDILDTYVVNGNVDMKTGNIFFTGDVIIKGDVTDHMMVESTGSIYVYGNVYNAKLTATQHIQVIGNVINSKIIAGQLSVLYSEIYQLLQDLSNEFQKLIGALAQLQNSIQNQQLTFHFSDVLITLIDTKFGKIQDGVNKFLGISKDVSDRKIQLPVKFKIVFNALAKFRSRNSIRHIDSDGILHSVLYSINDLIQEMESMICDESNVQVKSAQLSTIKTYGAITITKDGTIQSKLFAGTDIIFNEKDAVIRGGKLEAICSIQAGVVGTDLGEPPELYAGQSISMYKLYQSHIKFPNHIIFMDEYEENIVLKYDEKKEKVTKKIK